MQAGTRPSLAVVMDPIHAIHYEKDTTLAMLWAAQDAGFSLFYMELSDLSLADGQPHGRLHPLTVQRDPTNWYSLQTPRLAPLAELDVILMRKDPPFDMDYIYATYLLERAAELGVLVANHPASLRDCNEKLFAAQFPQCSPALLVSSHTELLRQFQQQHGDIILKPLDGMGGRSVFRVKPGDHNLGVIIETLTAHGRHPIMAQRFLPDISDGDKRILLIDGEPVSHCLARLPMQGENRGNLAAGGRGEVRPLTARDRWIAAQVAPELKRRQLYFVGLDVIGDYLTEINVTSPTCLREIEKATGEPIAVRFIASLQHKLAASSSR
ncbi:MAG: glutathione synthase [Pseudomonadales bacterium]|nr:glutathione synthase [Pseudomonadales bacterium]